MWAQALQRLTAIQAQRTHAASLAGAGDECKLRVGNALRSANDKRAARLRDAKWHELMQSLPAAEIADAVQESQPAAHESSIGSLERKLGPGSLPRKLRHAYNASERPRMMAVGRLTQACS